MLAQHTYNEKTSEEPQAFAPSALPLCSSCAAATPHLSALLENKVIQQKILTFRDIMASIDLASYKQQHFDREEETLPSEKDGLGESTGAPLAKRANNASNISADTQVDQTPCFLCTTRRAIPSLISLVGEAKNIRKETAANMSKADRKALKAEIKVQMKDVKQDVKRAKKELRGDRW